ncbi:MAG TPA: hypothetical protein VEZ11_15625, partial [Thermoanaerobaculia bacterium]|nr:hypothetical protein [Thermoanaerobaculia bacterium]
PVLSMTGTRDASLVFRTTVANRRRPFERIHRGDQYLVTIDDAVHRTFADLETEHDAMEAGRLDGPPGPQTRPPGGAEHQAHLGIIRGVTLAFWDAMLRGDAEAMKWLREGGAEKALGAAARFEKK